MAITFDFREDAFDQLPSPGYEVPVRMEIGGFDLLETYPITLTDIAFYGLLQLRRAQVEGKSIYHPDERGSPGLSFLMDGDDVLVHSELHPAEPTVRVSYQALVEAWDRFSDRAREFILQRFPIAVHGYPELAAWLAGEKEGVPTEDLMSTLGWLDEYYDCFQHVDAVETEKPAS